MTAWPDGMRLARRPPADGTGLDGRCSTQGAGRTGGRVARVALLATRGSRDPAAGRLVMLIGRQQVTPCVAASRRQCGYAGRNDQVQRHSSYCLKTANAFAFKKYCN